MSQFDETQTIVLSLSSTQGTMDLSQDNSSYQKYDEFPLQNSNACATQNHTVKKLDGDSTQNHTIQNYCNDSDDSTGDFTQGSLERSRQKSLQLKMDVAKLKMSKKKLNRVKAETYFMAKVDAKFNREKHAKKIKGKKAQQNRKKQRYIIDTEKMTTPHSESVTRSASSSSNVPKNKNIELFVTPSKTSCSFVTPNDKPTHTCSGCGHGIDDCHEAKYRYYCLHSVLDYFEEVGMSYVTQHGIYAAVLRSYTVALKKDMLETTKYYEINIDCELPDCMEKGTLADAQMIHRSNHLFQTLMATRVRDVVAFVEDVKAGRVETPSYPKFT